MSGNAVPLWAQIITAIFVLLGASVTLIGAVGVVKLKSFYARIHAPTLGTTVGVWSIGIATAFHGSWVGGRPVLKGLVIPVLVTVTVPVTTIFLMRAALFRDRIAGKPVPANLTHRSVRPVLPTNEVAVDAAHREVTPHARAITP